MTGEITLSGLVLPVGGIREKALAARRHGIKTFILPARNEADLAELPAEVKNGMRFVPVETLEEVLTVALPPPISKWDFPYGRMRLLAPTPQVCTIFQTTEATVGYRIVPDVTARGSYMARKAFTRNTWDHQVGVSLVWARRWR